jgi:hypothetical protein
MGGGRNCVVQRGDSLSVWRCCNSQLIRNTTVLLWNAGESSCVESGGCVDTIRQLAGKGHQFIYYLD